MVAVAAPHRRVYHGVGRRNPAGSDRLWLLRRHPARLTSARSLKGPLDMLLRLPVPAVQLAGVSLHAPRRRRRLLPLQPLDPLPLNSFENFRRVIIPVPFLIHFLGVHWLSQKWGHSTSHASFLTLIGYLRLGNYVFDFPFALRI